VVEFIDLFNGTTVYVNPDNVKATRDNYDDPGNSTIIEYVGGGQVVVKGDVKTVNKKLKA